MGLDVGKNLPLAFLRLVAYGLELEILEDGTLVQGDAALKVVLIGVADEGFRDEVEVVAMALGSNLGKELEGLLSLYRVKVLACKDVIDSQLYGARDRQILSADLGQRVDVLTVNLKELSHTVLGMVHTHVPVDNDLMLHIFALDRESNCGLIEHLMISQSVHVIILKF